MADRLVIIHGWSDNYDSFKNLGTILKDNGVAASVDDILLGNYISMDDEVTYNDIVTAMDRAWSDKDLSRTPRSVDVVVHSTGGLVIRHWLSNVFAPGEVPIHRLLMLAPANFGSPLAHKGRSFLGRVVKGWDAPKRFQTGELILKGLELASPYSWNLSMQDRFVDWQELAEGNAPDPYYEKQRILCTVLVGNEGYDGVAAAANEDGSDGTVRVSTANMNCDAISVDYATAPHNPTWKHQQSTGQCAFGIMQGENHSTVAAKDKGFRNAKTLRFIVDALQVEDDGFDQWCQALDNHNDTVMDEGKDRPYTHGYQNTVFRLRDQFGAQIKDYFLEFYEDDADTGDFAKFFSRHAIRTVHPYGDDKSYRSVYVDCTTLYRHIDKLDNHLDIRLAAHPELSQNGNVGYRTFTEDDLGSLKLDLDMVHNLFRPNRTLLVDMVIHRYQNDQVFQFKTMND